MAMSSASRRGILRTHMGARVQFCNTVKCGNRLKCWNTMPTSLRLAVFCFRSRVRSRPSTSILPAWCSSSRLMQRMVVDLPEPDGPQMTMRSPLRTWRLMSLSTWNCPYHLFTSIISIIRWLSGSACCFTWFMFRSSMSTPGFQLALQMQRVAGNAETEDPVDRRRKYITLGGHAQPGRVRGGALDAVQEIEEADDDDQAGVLEQRDEGVDDAGNHQFERLGQHHQAHHAPVAQAQRLGGLVLPLGNGLQAAAHHFGDVGGLEEDHHDHGAQQLVEV